MKNFKLDLDKLETLEGRASLEIMMEPLGVRHLNITKTMAKAVKCKKNAVLFCGAGAASRDAQARHAAGDDGRAIDAER